MKTKIVYISGAEVFDVADVRAALDTVRNALNLGDDTIVFGVPVDRDSAFADASADTVENVAAVADVNDDDVVATDEPAETVMENVAVEPEVEAVAESEPEPAPAAPRRRGRPRKVESAAAEPAAPAVDTSAKVVPILSVLAAKSDVADEVVADEKADDDVADDVVSDVVADATDEVADVVSISDVELDAELVAPATDNVDAMRVTVSEMIVDDAPVAETEKTLEQLLESMTPLCDDHIAEDIAAETVDVADVEFDDAADETDATLEKLAAEFAESEPQIAPAPKATTGGGKIGKLKNILPFKKARRDGGSSFRDDLFNWAGIAANDEEFAIPGFFANATNK